MKTAYIMVGIPGSGKSTWIKNNIPNAAVVSRDIIRTKLGFCQTDEKCVGTPEQESRVTDEQNYLIHKYCRMGIDFVVDNTNLNKYRVKLVQDIRKNYPDIKIVYVVMGTKFDTCKTRRKGQISQDVMDRMKNGYKEPNESEYDEIIHVEDNTKKELNEWLKEIVSDTMLKYGGDIFGYELDEVVSSILFNDFIPDPITLMEIIDKTDYKKKYLAEERNKLWDLYINLGLSEEE